MVCVFGRFAIVSDPQQTDAVLFSPPRVLLRRSSPITPGNPSLSAAPVNEAARAGEGGDAYKTQRRARMKWPFPAAARSALLFSSTGTINSVPPTAGTITPLAL